MKKRTAHPVISHLKSLRRAKGLTQSGLAEQIGVQRQAIYDMESGRYLPNTAVALRLAEILDCRVEDIFTMDTSRAEPPVTLMAPEVIEEDARVALARVRGKLVGFPLTGRHAIQESILPADAICSGEGRTIRLLQPESSLDQRATLLGCDPAFGMVSLHVSRSGGPHTLLHRFASSQGALEALSAGHTHVAGIHLHNTGSGEANVNFAHRILGDFKGLVIGFSKFEEGLMVAPGNPLKIHGVADLARKDVRMVNREPGAALRSLLEDCLKKEAVPEEAVRGFGDIVTSHSEGAQRVLFGTANAALGLRVVAAVYGLAFITISAVRCDLVIPGDLMDHQAVKVLLDVIHSKTFREELNSLPGYESSETGKVLLRR